MLPTTFLNTLLRRLRVAGIFYARRPMSNRFIWQIPSGSDGQNILFHFRFQDFRCFFRQKTMKRFRNNFIFIFLFENLSLIDFSCKLIYSMGPRRNPVFVSKK